MAHQAIPPIDGFGLVAREDSLLEAIAGGQSGADEAAYSLLGNTSSAKASATPLADLALDLVLNEIVQQARLATTATGATIRLARKGDVVCRAAAGATAAEIAAYLKLRSGIVGACLQTGRVQRCEDAEADSRLDAASCRRLGLRSILMVPVKNASQETLGVFEVFSARARAFSDRDVLTLQALSRRILANIDLAARIMTAAAADPVATPAAVNRLPLDLPVDSDPGSVPRAGSHSARNWLFLLVVALVASALLVGWTLGRTGLGRADAGVEIRQDASRANGPSGNSSAIVPPAVVPPAVVSPAVVSPAVVSDVAAAVPASANIAAAASLPGTSNTRSNVKVVPMSPVRAGTPTAKSVTRATPNDSLVIYESRKSGLQKLQKEEKKEKESTRPAEAVAPVQDLAPASDGSGPSLLLSEEMAEANLLSRVDPQYPKIAIDQHIQGRVVLEVSVSQTGAVRGVRAISGESVLTAAATDALQQWRFRPYFVNGRPTNFDTRVTLSFALP